MCQLSAQFYAGVKSGYTKAWQDYGNTRLPADAKTHNHSYHLSTVFNYQVNTWLGLRAEPGYVRRGAACEPGFINFNSDTKLSVHYVNIPIGFVFLSPTFLNRFRFYSKIAASMSSVLSGTRKIMSLPNGDLLTKEKLNFDPEERYNQIVIGFQGGLGANFALGEHQIFVESVCYHGMLDVDSWNTSNNKTLQISVGYLISI